MKNAFLIVFLGLALGGHARVVFQENFEESDPNFDTFEIKRASVGPLGKSRVVWIDTLNDGYFRFKIPFQAGNFFRFDFYLDKAPSAPEKTFGFSFLIIEFYKTQQSSYTVSPLASFELRQPSGEPQPFLAPLFPRGTILRGLPLETGKRHTFGLRYEKTVDAALASAEVTVDGLSMGKLGPGAAMGDFTFVTFGGDSGRSLRIALDNVMLFDGPDTARPEPPAIAWTVTEERKLSLSLPPLGNDSLIRLLLRGENDGGFPILKRDLPSARARPYVYPTPLSAGKYAVEAAALKTNGAWTDYSPSETLTVPPPRAGHPVPEIFLSRITDEISGEPVAALERERWYVLSAALSQVKDVLLIVWLHHASAIQTGDRERGGLFNREDNYVFNFSLTNDPWLYATREDIRERTLRVDGQEYLYVNDRDHFFKVDSLNKSVRVRFKLLREARPGPWRLSGYLETDSGRSDLYTRSFTVLTELEAEQQRMAMRTTAKRRLRLTVAALLTAAGLAEGFRRWRRRRPLPASAQNLLETLTAGGFYLNNPEFKHRHWVTKAQKFILENYAGNISLAEVAAHLGVSPAWAGRVFKQATGLTVVEFLQRLRVDRAQKDLTGTELPITDIAMAAGFSNVDHFRRVFKEHTGKLPSDFRESS